MTWPNFISLGRLFSTPLIVWLLVSHAYSWAFIVVFFAGLSDILDGLLARIMKERSKIGTYLDPLADKILLVALFITLGVQGHLPLWLVILVVSRDALIIGGMLLLLLFDKDLEVKPLLISKINTFLQILIVTALMGQLALSVMLPAFNEILFMLAALMTLLSGFAYIRVWVKAFND